MWYKGHDTTLEPNDHSSWWLDSSYAVHQDMQSHIGIVMSLCKGAAYLTSCKQKFNTKSSTEAELVAIDDVMTQILWTRNFLKGQGIYVPTTTSTRTTKVPYCWLKMESHQAAGSCDI